MKKIFLIAIAAICCCVSLQAQTCKVASTGGKRVIQIEVNLDSLEGRTLVTTINHVQNNVVLNMSYEGEPTAKAAAREDSSEMAQNLNEAEATMAEASEPTKASEPTAPATKKPTAPATKKPNYLSAFGINEIAGFLGLSGGSGNANGSAETEEEETEMEKYLQEHGAAFVKSITVADSTKYTPVYPQRKWKWLKNYRTFTDLRLSGMFGQDFDMGSDDEQAAEEISEDDYGVDPEKNYNGGGSAEISQVFIKGHYDENGKFVPNNLHFGWSIGGLFAMDFQKDYGWSSDIMAKVGIQAGTDITMGVDALVGTGWTPYMIYSTDGLDYRTIRHSQMCFKYGVQGWVSMNYGSNTYTTLFAKLVKSVAPSSVYEHPTADGWENVLIDFDKGSWQVGFAVGYKFGYNADIQSKRLQATAGIGANLIGDGGLETIVEVEKVNNVSPTLDFSYGVGMSKNDNGLSFYLNGTWAKKFNPTSKFSYLAKIYAGMGEYLVGKYCLSEDSHFEMTTSSIKQICAKAGLGAGVSYKNKCSSFSAYLRGGYHYGFETIYNGFETAEDQNFNGFDLMPVLSYSLQF